MAQPLKELKARRCINSLSGNVIVEKLKIFSGACLDALVVSVRTRVGVCVCVCNCICMHACVRACVNICACIHVDIRRCISVRVCAFMIALLRVHYMQMRSTLGFLSVFVFTQTGYHIVLGRRRSETAANGR